MQLIKPITKNLMRDTTDYSELSIPLYIDYYSHKEEP